MSPEWAEIEGVDGMETGTSPMLRGAALQGSSGLVGPLFLSSASSAALFTLSFSTFFSLLQHVPYPSNLTLYLLPRSVSCYISPYSVRLCSVTTAAADIPLSWVKSSPPQMTKLSWGAPGAHALTLYHLFLFEIKQGRITFYVSY